MSTKPTTPDNDAQPTPDSVADEPGSNATEHEPNLDAEPLPDGHHKFIPKSPFTAGNT